jgi:hypothetical protein
MRSPARTWNVLAAVLMVVYVAAVIAGKVATLTGRPNPLALGELGEFLVVLASIVFFVTGILATPGQADRKGGGPR